MSETEHQSPALASMGQPGSALQKIATGTPEFINMRKHNNLLVDKTAKLAQLVDEDKVFLSRPRRFGKTTLISTLKELFTHGTVNFAGLAVHQLWHESQYPVIALSFYNLRNPQTFESELCTHLREQFNKAGFRQALKIAPEATTLSELLVYLDSLIQGQTIVLLIDEWDFPLSATLNDRIAFDANLQVLNTFFRWVRLLTNTRFILVTGIGRYQDTATLSGQDITDISFEPLYGDLLGYTQAEVETYFAPYITKAAALLELSEDDFLDQLKQQYNGFCFERNAQVKVYCPWAINKFFKQIQSNPTNKPQFRHYWSDSGNAPRAIRSFLEAYQPDLSFLTKVKEQGLILTEGDLTHCDTFNSVKFEPLLVQSGYLTIKEVIDPDNYTNKRSFICGFPNLEVEADYAGDFLRYITTKNNDEAWFTHTSTQLKTALLEQNMASATEALNEFLCALPYDVSAKAHEAEFRTFICWSLLFSQSYDRIREETFNTRGRSDLEVEIAGNLYVIELKLLPKNAGKQACLTLADQAQHQIQDRIYGHNLATWQVPHYQKCWGLVLVLSAQTRQIAYWRLMSCDHAHSQYQVLGNDWCKPLKPDADVSAASTTAATSANASAPAPSAQDHDTSDPMALKLAVQLELKLAAITPQHPITLNPDFLIEGLLLTYEEMRALKLDAKALAQKLPALVQVVLTKAQAAPTDQPLTVDAELLEQRLLQELSRALSHAPQD